MVVDKLTKYDQLFALSHPYSVVIVAQIFIDQVYKIYGLPNSIVSDRDPIFTISFWREMLRQLGISLCLPSSYHPQTMPNLMYSTDVWSRT